MKWCEKCKKGNDDLNAKYCVNCGNELILKNKKNVTSIFSVIFFVCFISITQNAHNVNGHHVFSVRKPTIHGILVNSCFCSQIIYS